MNSKNFNFKNSFRQIFHLSLLAFLFLLSACGDISSISKSKTETYYGESKPLVKQEFRWSNGKLPTTLDPAFASASPETDVIRAIFDCLTEIDAKTLKPQKSLAVDWKHSEDFKTWTFQIRKEAKWSNGESVTAKDFVRSWNRLATFGEKAAYSSLLKNIVGTKILQIKDSQPTSVNNEKNTEFNASKPEKAEKTKFGVEAIGRFTLKISLVEPDEDLPSLIANPMFAAIYDESEFDTNKLNTGITTNGAFRITSIGNDGVTLDRSENYWNKANVKLTRVRFIPMENAENALQAYKEGQIDVLTNFYFEPLVLKLLNPFKEFNRTKHSAINLYEFNLRQKPFDDVRVREALAISLDRQRLTEDELDGAAEPAFAFSLFNSSRPFRQNVEKARKLFSAANFDNGQNFPVVRLIVNRNDTQKRVAKAVAAMWKKNLNIETEIIVKENNDFEIAKTKGEFDLIRRGFVLPTTNELANIETIFSNESNTDKLEQVNDSSAPTTNNTNANNSNSGIENSNENTIADNKSNPEAGNEIAGDAKPILSETQAIAEIPAIPLYYPKSYSLVKPYVQGFETNVLDAPSLKTVKIDENWQPDKENGDTKNAQSVF